MSKIYIIHENNAWTAPLLKELEALGLPYQTWFLDRGQVDINNPPPNGVFYNRMSASSHTRGHRYAAEYTGAVLTWLESYGRRVLNPRRALHLEISKIAQYTALNAIGIKTPRSIAVVGQDELIDATSNFSGSFVTKHNPRRQGAGRALISKCRSITRICIGSRV